MYFFIGTRDFNGISKFLNRYYRDVYPFEYLKEYTDLDEDTIGDIVYGNLLSDGFLFHITPQSNVENILANGLLTLNDKYSCDMYQRCNEVSETYSCIKDRNQGLDILKMRQIVSIPGITGYEHDRFHNVFLSSSLDYALKTYGQNGELSTMFLRDIFWAFGIKQKLEGLSKRYGEDNPENMFFEDETYRVFLQDMRTLLRDEVAFKNKYCEVNHISSRDNRVCDEQGDVSYTMTLKK